MREWLADRWYDAAYWLSGFGLTLGLSLRTEGHRHIPLAGPALLIANHQSFFDPVLVGLAARRHLCYLARQTLYRNPLFAALIRSFRAVPVNQEGFAREGLQTVLKQLQDGRAVLIFPEGERTPNGQMGPLRPGIHLLIKRVDMPIVPVGIAGAYDAWPRWRPLPRLAPLFLPPEPGTCAVAIAPPLDSRRYQKLPRQQVLDELAGALRKVWQRAERIRRKPQS